MVSLYILGIQKVLILLKTTVQGVHIRIFFIWFQGQIDIAWTRIMLGYLSFGTECLERLSKKKMMKILFTA